MENNEDFWIPRTLDAPMLFFIWSADSAIVFIVWAILGAVMGGLGFLFGIVIGFFFFRSYERLKEEGGSGLMLKILYWFTPSQWASIRNPSHIREHVGR